MSAAETPPASGIGAPPSLGAEASPPASGTDAPPPADRPNAAPPVTREYRNGAIAVQWNAERCIHSARCIRAQPAVFDPKRRPWVLLDGADADAVADAVMRCPTGALHFTRLDGGPAEPMPAETTVEPVRDGPLYVRGPVAITTEGGTVVRRDTRVALCRCGHSMRQPFCDNTHRAIGFRDGQ